MKLFDYQVVHMLFNPEFGRYDDKTKKVLDYLLEYGKLPKSLKNKQLDETLTQNITKLNKQGNYIKNINDRISKQETRKHQK